LRKTDRHSASWPAGSACGGLGVRPSRGIAGSGRGNRRSAARRTPALALALDRPGCTGMISEHGRHPLPRLDQSGGTPLAPYPGPGLLNRNPRPGYCVAGRWWRSAFTSGCHLFTSLIFPFLPALPRPEPRGVSPHYGRKGASRAVRGPAALVAGASCCEHPCARGVACKLAASPARRPPPAPAQNSHVRPASGAPITARGESARPGG